MPAFPAILGNEAAGVVEAVGRDVRGVAVGDRVAYADGPLGSYATARLYPADLVVRIPLDPFLLAPKSLYVTWPIRPVYTEHRAQLEAAAADLFDAIQRGILDVSPSRTYGLDDIVTAHRDLERGKANKAAKMPQAAQEFFGRSRIGQCRPEAQLLTVGA